MIPPPPVRPGFVPGSSLAQGRTPESGSSLVPHPRGGRTCEGRQHEPTKNPVGSSPGTNPETNPDTPELETVVVVSWQDSKTGNTESADFETIEQANTFVKHEIPKIRPLHQRFVTWERPIPPETPKTPKTANSRENTKIANSTQTLGSRQ